MEYYHNSLYKRGPDTYDSYRQALELKGFRFTQGEKLFTETKEIWRRGDLRIIFRFFNKEAYVIRTNKGEDYKGVNPKELFNHFCL